jgi:hypothetical protein
VAPRLDQASRHRRGILGLVEDYRHFIQRIVQLRELLKGSVYELKTRCGKSACHCAASDGTLHSTTVLSWSQTGRTRLRSIRPEHGARLRRLTGHYRNFRQARAGLVKTHRQLLLAVDRLEKVLLSPPPKQKNLGKRRGRS